jgi:regulator of sigma E protease
MFDWVIPFLLVLTVLVFVHELGHYLVARRYGVRVETFSIGFGPELFGWTDRHGTRWKFSAIPLGGYVKMFGEMDFAEDDERPQLSEDERRVSFHHKPLRQKAAIVAAGPAANFLFAVVALFGLFAVAGEPAPLPVVGTVQAGSAAERAGIAAGDEIRAIDGTPVAWFDDVRRIVAQNPDVALRFDIDRAGAPVTVTATPAAKPSGADGGTAKPIGLLGVTPDLKRVGYQDLSLPAAVGAAVERTIGLATQILTTVGGMITGSRSAEELGGPIRIAQISGEIAKDGIISLIFFMAALSVNLGLINLFPVPMLDGGHLMFYAIEAVRGKPASPRVLEYSFRFGIALVLMLMVFATWNDIVNLKVIEFFRQLVS